MKYHIIKPDGLGREAEQQHVGGYIEHVKVLFGKNVCTMVVNEEGCAAGRDPLPINARATAVYWNATHEGRTPMSFEPLTMPLVHGTAVLYEGRLP